MADVVLGILAILAGLIFCFSGHFWLRLIFPIWGFFTGFSLGAGFIAGIGDDRFLGTVLGWIVGLVVGLVFAVLAYSFYAIAVVIVMASIGFTIGSGLIVALGIDWNWVGVTVGIVLGALAGLGALLVDMPRLLLTAFAAVAGAIATVAGLMLVFGAMDSADFGDGGFTDKVENDWWWYIVLLALAIAGLVSQLWAAAAMRASLRASWADPAPSRGVSDPV